MDNSAIDKINNWIRYCFYALFVLVPLVMWPTTSELFEFNKMWTVYGITLVIFLLWVSKVAITRQFQIRRTPLDIPILLFLTSQFISTFVSIDPHVSWWGYYSRFNGGLLSTIAYVFLYYAYATNVISKKSKVARSVKMIAVTLGAGIVVALWGFPSHFGADPTCLFFRQTLDTSCWTASFQPTVRIFSTLGQPNWLAAYLAVLIPISIAYAILQLKKTTFKNASLFSGFIKKFTPPAVIFFTSALLFYLDLLYANSQSGFIGFWTGMIVFIGLAGWLLISKQKSSEPDSSMPLTKNPTVLSIALAVVLFALISFWQGVPVSQLNQFTLKSLTSQQASKNVEQSPAEKERAEQQAGPALEVGGSSSGKIRLIVWEGTFKIFQNNPIFGTGPETFAYAYYKVRPIEHNTTSEWDFLYNKAHNEYLNYLTTSGIFGLATYSAIIILFFYTAGRTLYQQRNDNRYVILGTALLGGYVSILVSNFFGFSVVIINLFFFLIPLWLYDITSHSVFTHPLKSPPTGARMNAGSATVITFVGLVVLICQINLFRAWKADQHYALGNNLDKVGEYAQAWPELEKAVEMRPNEDLFKDELSVNLSTLALALHGQQQTTQAAQFAQRAKSFSDEVVQNHPHNVVYWKSRTRVLYTIAEIDPRHNKEALQAIKTAHELAPTDAKIIYNLALLYDQSGQREKAIEILNEAIALKPNYVDARYTLALYYAEQSKKDSDGGTYSKNSAREQLQYIIKHIDPSHDQVQKLLETL